MGEEPSPLFCSRCEGGRSRGAGPAKSAISAGLRQLTAAAAKQRPPRRRLRPLLLQSPASATIALFSKNQMGLFHTLTWWAYFYLPGRPLAWVYAHALPVRAAANVMRAVLRATTIVQRTNAAAKLFPGVVAAPLLIGALGGAGGKLLVDAVHTCAGHPLTGAGEGVGGWYPPHKRRVGGLCGWVCVSAEGERADGGAL